MYAIADGTWIVSTLLSLALPLESGLAPLVQTSNFLPNQVHNPHPLVNPTTDGPPESHERLRTTQHEMSIDTVPPHSSQGWNRSSSISVDSTTSDDDDNDYTDFDQYDGLMAIVVTSVKNGEYGGVVACGTLKLRRVVS